MPVSISDVGTWNAEQIGAWCPASETKNGRSCRRGRLRAIDPLDDLPLWPRFRPAAGRLELTKVARAETTEPDQTLEVGRVRAEDVRDVSALDARITKIRKTAYWNDIYQRYGKQRQSERFFFVARGSEKPGKARLLGFIIGEVRAWEFGSEPSGWIFALSVEPNGRLEGVGTALLETIEAEFRKAGVDKMRTMVARDDRLPLLFFRSQGMMAGPYLQLEKDLA